MAGREVPWQAEVVRLDAPAELVTRSLDAPAPFVERFAVAAGTGTDSTVTVTVEFDPPTALHGRLACRLAAASPSRDLRKDLPVLRTLIEERNASDEKPLKE